jgi:WD40 repeat protein
MNYYLNHIQIFKTHKAIIWAMKWSSFGDFLISCGTDGVIFFFGFSLKIIIYKSREREKFEKFFYESWNCLSFIKSFYFQGSYRRINWCENFNQCCIPSFGGKVFICKIFFKKLFKTINIAKKFYLDGFTAEIKDSNFSKNGLKIITCTRDKTLWFWEKIISYEFQCLLILQGHESDIKRTSWHPRFTFVISITYNGFIRVFKKKNIEISLLRVLRFSDFSLLDFDFDINGNSFFFCSNQGELINLSNYLFPNFSRPNKWKKEKKYISFFFLSRFSFFALNFSKSNAVFLITGEDETFHLIKNIKIKSRKKKKQYIFKGVKKNTGLNLENSFQRAQFGSINNCIWHPKNENLFATCGEDGNIHLWSFSNF